MKIKIIVMYLDLKRFFIDDMPRKIAFAIPAKIALWCFVRVVAIRGDCPQWYGETYSMFMIDNNIKRM
jgi:hypothetical protein